MIEIKTKLEIEKMTHEERFEYLKKLNCGKIKMLIFEGFPGGYISGQAYKDLIKVLRFKKKQLENEENSWMQYYH